MRRISLRRADLRRFPDDTRGVAAVELALMFPFFLTFVMGAVDTSNLLLETHRIEQGLELGASYVAKARNPDTITVQARNVAVTGLPTGGASRVRGWQTSDVSVSITSLCGSTACSEDRFRTGADARMVVLSSRHTYQGFGFIRSVTRGRIVINARHEERIEL